MHAATTIVFRIPPGKADYEVRASHRFQRDGLLLALQPHMHYRGKSFRYEARYPDGRTEDAAARARLRFQLAAQIRIR